MCQKRQRHCDEYWEMRCEAEQEWMVADELEHVLAAWGRFGGRVTKHRYGRQHFVEAGRKGGKARRSK